MSKKYMISISKDLLNKIFETKKFEKEYKYDVASYIDIKLKQFPANLTQKELEEKLKDFVLQYLSKSDLEEAQQSYLDEYGLDAINVMNNAIHCFIPAFQSRKYDCLGCGSVLLLSYCKLYFSVTNRHYIFYLCSACLFFDLKTK